MNEQSMPEMFAICFNLLDQQWRIAPCFQDLPPIIIDEEELFTNPKYRFSLRSSLAPFVIPPPVLSNDTSLDAYPPMLPADDWDAPNDDSSEQPPTPCPIRRSGLNASLPSPTPTRPRRPSSSRPTTPMPTNCPASTPPAPTKRSATPAYRIAKFSQRSSPPSTSAPGRILSRRSLQRYGKKLERHADTGFAVYTPEAMELMSACGKGMFD